MRQPPNSSRPCAASQGRCSPTGRRLGDEPMRTLLLIPLVLSALSLPGGQEVGGSLAEDARVGVVEDRQKTAMVRPVGRERWTPLGARGVLMPGIRFGRAPGGRTRSRCGSGGAGSWWGPEGRPFSRRRGEGRFHRSWIASRPGLS